MQEEQQEFLFCVEQLKRAGAFSMDTDHFHDTYEIYYLLAGERNYYINNLLYDLRKGDLIFINRNELHRTMVKGTVRHERILINFRQEFLQGMLRGMELAFPFISEQCLLLRPDVHEQGNIESILFAMLEEQQGQRTQQLPYLQTLLVQLLIEMNRISGTAPAAIAPASEEKKRKVYDIIEYLQTHFSGTLALAELSERFYLSIPYLCRLFKQTTGFTVIEYVNTIRVQEAQRRLRESNESVTRIAEETGFDSIAHFGRVFKGITKRSPLQYRKQNR